MLRPLAWLGRRATAAIALGVFLGLALPPLASLFRPLLVPAIVLPFIVALLRLDWTQLLTALRAPLLPLVALAWLLLASPLVVALAVAPLPLPPAIAAAMVTTAACAPLMASGALAMLLGLDVILAVLVTVLATALVPMTLPPLALHLAGIAVELDAAALSLRLALLVGGAFAAATALRRLMGKERIARSQDALGGLAVLGLVAFAIAIMAGVPAMARAAPAYVVQSLAAVFALNIGLQALTWMCFRPLGPRRALTMGLVAGNNNIGIVLAAMADLAPPEFTVYVAMAQFPIYLLPLLQRPVYRRLLGEGDPAR
jgi:predicted Na+-dependent transporter